MDLREDASVPPRSEPAAPLEQYRVADVRLELDRILASRLFVSSPRMARFLRHVVERTLEGDSEGLKESVIGTEVFDRRAGYDAKSEPIVRTEARRLRSKLGEYYEQHPREARVRISMPTGGYVAEFTLVRRVLHIETGIAKTQMPRYGSAVPQAAPAPALPVRSLQELDDSRTESAPVPVLRSGPREIDLPPEIQDRDQWFRRAWTRAALVVLGASGLAAVGLGGWLLRSSFVPKAPSGPVVHFAIDLPAGQSLSLERGGLNLALSPDGRLVAYVAIQDGALRLFVYDTTAQETKVIPGGEGAVFGPVFSPDGQLIAAQVNDHIRVFRPDGTQADVADLAHQFAAPGLVWVKEGLFFNNAPLEHLEKAPSILFRLPATLQGRPTLVLPVDITIPGDQALMMQQVLPDGNRYLISGRTNPPHSRFIAIVNPGSHRTNIVLDDAMGGYYVPSGHLVFYRNGDLWAVPLDLNAERVTGPPALVVHGVSLAGWQGPDIAVSQSGTLAYTSGEPTFPDHRFLWVDLRGKEYPVPLPPGPYNPLDLSPDGSKLLFSDALRQNWTLWSYDFRDGASFQVAGPSPDVIVACFNYDATEVIFGSKQHNIGVGEILMKSAMGHGPETRLTSHDYFGHFPQTKSKDGRWVAYTFGTLPQTKSDIWSLDLTAQHGPIAKPIVQTAGWDMTPAISPDGHFIAYTSVVDNSPQVFLDTFPKPAHSVQLTSDGGAGPIWSPDGKRIYFRNGRRMRELRVGDQGEAPRDLFEGDYLPPDKWERYALLNSDGTRFLLVREERATKPQRINLVVNWFAELSRALVADQ